VASALFALLRSSRPSHWIKNAFVLAPALFGLRAFAPALWGPLAEAFAAFSLAASATYLVNDWADREKDRQNPRTQARPLARGQLSPLAALSAAFFFTVAGLFLAGQAGCLEPLLGYLVASLAYTFCGKKLPILDLLLLSLLYILRLLAGAQVAQVPPSPWLLLCGGLLALLLSLGKRLEGFNPHYSLALARHALTALTWLTLAAYGAYALQPSTWNTFSPAFALTLGPVAFALFRFRRLALAGRGDPMEALFSQPSLLAATGFWLALVLLLAWQAS